MNQSKMQMNHRMKKDLSHHKLLAVHFAVEVLDDLTVKAVVDFGTLLSEELSVVECMTKIVRQIVSVSR